MALLDIRHRAGYLFVAVTIGHVVLISAQVGSREGVPLLETATVGTVTEAQRAVATALGALRNVWRGYVHLGGVRAENLRLQQELAATQLALQGERARADRTRGLEDLLALRDRTTLQTTAAEVIAGAAMPEFRTFTIDKGAWHGLGRDMAVLAPAGVVGRVVVAGPRAAKVQLLIDRNAAAGALVERSRVQGLVVGVGDGRLRLDYLPEMADVQVGDRVITSGIDGIFPKGFDLGRVASIDRTSGAYREIGVEPAVDFARVEEVLVVVSPAPYADDTTEASP